MKCGFLLIVLGCLLFASAEVRGQNAYIQKKKGKGTQFVAYNSLNLDLLGNGSLLSLNYHRVFLRRRKFMLAGQLGAGWTVNRIPCFFNSDCNAPASFTSVPHAIIGSVGKGKHYFDFGWGGSLVFKGPDPNYYPWPVIGYHLHPLDPGDWGARFFVAWPANYAERNIFYIPVGMGVSWGF